MYIYIFMCVCPCVVISSRRSKKNGVDYSYIEYMWNFIQIYGSAGCMAIVIYSFSGLYNTECIQCNWEKTQTWLNCHYQFILANNIIILPSRLGL